MLSTKRDNVQEKKNRDKYALEQLFNDSLEFNTPKK